MALDPNAKTHGPEINLLDTKIADLLERSETGDPLAQILDIRAAWNAFKQDNRMGRDMAASIIAVEKAVMSEKGTARVWDQILSTLEVRRRTLDSEQRRLKDMQQMIPVEEMLILVRYISESMKAAHVKYTDPLTARRIFTDISRDIQLCVSRYTGSRVTSAVPTEATT